jgi:hypothetical protein
VAIAIPLFVLVGIVAAFAPAMPVVTRIGASERDRLLGLREYIRRAERTEVEAHHRDERVPLRFEEILPYAIALGVVDLWLDEFGGLTRPPVWYEIDGTEDATAFSTHVAVFCDAAVGALGGVGATAS